MKTLLAILLALSTPFAKADSDGLSKFSKFCLGNYCIGDSAAKHGGLKQIYEASAVQWDLSPTAMQFQESALFKQPNCLGMDTDLMLAPGEKRKSENHIHIKFSADPSKANSSLDDYYVITSIQAFYPTITSDQERQISDKIFARAGIKKPRNNGFGYEVKFGTGTLSLLVGQDRTELKVVGAFGDFFTDAYKKQPGCSGKTPNL